MKNIGQSSSVLKCHAVFGSCGGLGGGFQLAKPVNLSLALLLVLLKPPFMSCWSFLVLADQRDPYTSNLNRIRLKS